ncbi:uncharacterized protein PRCAT00002565001 [Priceomyces carsonii]|uniref:uncharacterized protein n=1 Tax=Priceomyces carsonii TaxID=28549 RepID=UPI002ED868AD|nr:unnamed protein product [Priceomyces carsonii]
MSGTDNPHKLQQPSYNDKRIVLNKANLIEPITRHRIQDSIFYKQHLYLTNEATILPCIVREVRYIGGVDSNTRPCPFFCCLLRLLELEPPPAIIRLYLDQLGFNEFKYLTALTLMYIRFAWSNEDIYKIFDKYYSDFRKLRFHLKTPIFNEHNIAIKFEVRHMDEWVDSLLSEERILGLILPRLVPRYNLVEKRLLEERKYNISSDEDVLDHEESSYESDSD